MEGDLVEDPGRLGRIARVPANGVIGGRPLEEETGEKGAPGAVPEIGTIGGTAKIGEAKC